MLTYGKTLIVTIAIALCFLLGFFQKYSVLPAVPPQIGQYLTCASPLSTNRDVLNVYLTETAMANTLLSALCANRIVNKQFGDVHLIIGQNDYDTFRYINHGVSDLALVKSNVVKAFGANVIYGYEEIAAHDNYSAYFIALREKPELSKEYLLGKRIGILDYPSSRSGHIVPKTILQSLGLNEGNMSLQFYSSHKELRRALMAGEVDLISSYWGQSDEQTLSKNYITALEENVSGMRWYLKMQTRNTDLRCALQNVVKTVTEQSAKTYYQRVNLLNECAPHD